MAVKPSLPIGCARLVEIDPPGHNAFAPVTEDIVMQIKKLQRVATELSLQDYKSFRTGLRLWRQHMTAST